MSGEELSRLAARWRDSQLPPPSIVDKSWSRFDAALSKRPSLRTHWMIPVSVLSLLLLAAGFFFLRPELFSKKENLQTEIRVEARSLPIGKISDFEKPGELTTTPSNRVTLEARTRIRLLEAGERTMEMEILSGKIRVENKSSGAFRNRLRHHTYRFEEIGTVYEITVSPSGTALTVSEGWVRIRSDLGELVADVKAGERWDSTAPKIKTPPPDGDSVENGFYISVRGGKIIRRWEIPPSDPVLYHRTGGDSLAYYSGGNYLRLLTGPAETASLRTGLLSSANFFFFKNEWAVVNASGELQIFPSDPSGKSLYQEKLLGETLYEGALSSDGILAVTDITSTVVFFDLKNRKRLFEKKLEDKITGPAVWKQGRVRIPTERGGMTLP